MYVVPKDRKLEPALPLDGGPFAGSQNLRWDKWYGKVIRGRSLSVITWFISGAARLEP